MLVIIYVAYLALVSSNLIRNNIIQKKIVGGQESKEGASPIHIKFLYRSEKVIYVVEQ